MVTISGQFYSIIYSIIIYLKKKVEQYTFQSAAISSESVEKSNSKMPIMRISILHFIFLQEKNKQGKECLINRFQLSHTIYYPVHQRDEKRVKAVLVKHSAAFTSFSLLNVSHNEPMGNLQIYLYKKIKLCTLIPAIDEFYHIKNLVAKSKQNNGISTILSEKIEH